MAQIDAVLVVVKSVRRADLQLAIVVLGVKVEPAFVNPGHQLGVVLQIEWFGCPAELVGTVVGLVEVDSLEMPCGGDLPVVAQYIRVEVEVRKFFLGMQKLVQPRYRPFEPTESIG